MKRIIFLFLVLLAPLVLPGAKKKADWNTIPVTISKNSEAVMKSFSPEEFNLTLIPAADNSTNCSVQIVRTIDAPRHSQGKLYFRARSVGGETVRVHLILTIRENGKIRTCWGPRIKISGSDFKRYLFGLDSTFNLGDKEYHIWQFKPSFGIDGVRPGHKVEVEIRDFQIDSAENIGTHSDKPEITVYPPERPSVTPEPDAMRIFFHFDNGDCRPLSAKGMSDPIPYPGFREILISTVKRRAVIADSPEHADVIVYAAAKPDPVMAKRIAAAVRNGTPLYAAAIVSDPEIRELLPVQISSRPVTGYPERETVRAANPGDPLFRGLSGAKFGIYHDLTVKSGARIRLVYSGGAPLIAEGAAGKGKVVYNALGTGVELIPGKAAYDPLLLRILAELTGKPLPEAAQPPANKENGWLYGASENNIGRVGFALGDGLLCETISNTLSVSGGSGEYEFHSEPAPRLRIPRWHLRPVSGSPVETEKETGWEYRHGQFGVVELTAQVEIPEKWRGTPLRFQVEGGIDDTAKVWFNGEFLGEVTQDMPNYWNRPHRYTLPEKRIRFGKPNTIRILTENIRESGGFGSCPEIVPARRKKQQWEVRIDRANPIGKGGTVIDRGRNASWRFDTSLAFPGVRWEFPGKRIHMALSNLASSAAVFRNGKTELLDLARNEAVPCDGWDLPVLLLFPKNAGTPLLLIFSSSPDSITVERFGAEVGGITIERKNGIGMILPMWLYGKQSVDVSGWKTDIPEETLRRIRFWLPKAFAYPVAYREVFRIDDAAKRVRIRSRYFFKETGNDWKIAPERYAPVSPLAFFMKGALFEADGVENWKLATSFGWYAAKPAADTVEWSLPLPVDNLPLVPRIKGQEDIHKITNDIFRKGIRFIGGSRPVKTADFIHPFKPDSPTQTIGLHMWLHGTADTVTAPYDLNAENRKRLTERIRYRLFLPVEQYAYKVGIWREEPFSGLRYPICYNSPRPHHTRFAPGKGSNFNSCDDNETVYMITTVARAAADQQGQTEFVRANATWFRWFTKRLFVGDDWITLTGHCGESGAAASIDMLNCEYPGMLNLARIAEIADDPEWRAQCLYRAARRMVAVVARLPFKYYSVEAGFTARSPELIYGTGFSENGYDYRFGAPGRAPSYHLFDMSQGIPQKLFPLYEKYAKKEIDDYFRTFVVPYLYDKNGNFRQDHKLLNIAVHSSVLSREEKIRALRACLNSRSLLRKLSGDYPGMTLASNIAMALEQIHGKVRVFDSRDVEICDLEFNPAENRLRIKLRAGRKPVLILSSDLLPADPVFRRSADGLIHISLRPCEEKTLELQFR